MAGRGGGRDRAVGRTGWILAWVGLAAMAAGACGGGDGGGEPAPADGEPAAESAEAGRTGEAADLQEVNRFLSYSPSDSMVDLELYGGYGGANGAWNFDGYYDGNATIVVPLGWEVRVTYQTLDANVPHSAGIVEPVEPIPADGSGVTVAFPGAVTPSFITGISSTRDPVQFRFSPDEAGRYWVLCGVPGHARGGMWIWLEVSAEAAAPDFREEEA